MRTLVVTLLFVTAAHAQRDRSHGRSTVISQGGIVATSQVLASQAGAQILAQGGSAVDAAIAANAVLGVVEPGMDGIGGDLFVLYREAKTGKLHGLNGSGYAPKGLTRDYLLKKGYKTMPGEGIDSVSVPGCVDGWAKMHERFGKLPWKTLFTAAIHYAEHGFPIQEMDSASWDSPRMKGRPESKAVFQPEGRAPKAGEIFRNPGLAKALKLIAANGPREYYQGELSLSILNTVRKHGGVMNAEDLAQFSSEWVTPISTDYRGWRVSELPPNGQGISALIMLNLMERFQPGPTTMHPGWLHTKIEAMKLAYSDLGAYVADPKFSTIPVEPLLAKPYAAERAKQIKEQANCDARPGQPIASDTTYLSVVDKDGNIASWIQSVSSLWGSGIVVAGMGFHLHNRAAGFTMDPKHPNVVAGRKRPFHTIIPGMLQKGDTHVGFGIMSGANQPLAHAQFVSNYVDHGLNLQAALEAPRFTKGNAKGCNVTIESRVGIEAIQGLSAKGHMLDVRGEHSTRMGRGNAVLYDARTKVMMGASDSRADGAAIPEPLR